ncbi:MAG: type II toxin-antitoxin system VapC family toxin [Variovorax sp.]
MKQNITVLRHLRDVGRDALCVSSVVVGELAFGVARSAETHRARNASTLQSFLSIVTALPWSVQAAWIYGAHRQRLKVSGTAVGELDLMIGSHALAEGLILVTNNTREFARIDGLRLEDWTAA